MQAIFLNYLFFLQFLYFDRKFFDFRWKLFGQFVITLFFASIGTYWGKMKKELCGRKIIFIPLSETARKTSAWWSTRHTVRQWELYADHFSELFVFLLNFCTLSANFSHFCWKLSGEFVTTLFFVSLGTYWGKIKKKNFAEEK